MTDIVHQLPDFIFFQTFEKLHPGAVRAVFDDPEHLPVGYLLHGLIAGEVPGIRLHPRKNDSESVTLEPVAGFAGNRLDTLVKQLFSRGKVLFAGRQDIGHSGIRFGGGRRAADLRAQSRPVHSLHLHDFRLRGWRGDLFFSFASGQLSHKE